ncbi:RNA-binding protein hfq [Scytonema sp. UIC 10036]|uniref:Hfq-related RNA-binding protein n=1 Tax=Scytonema sp. UIC 10036 TaxID=2304196 RepID=UPI0012DABED0|nr:RNA-binding protein hfq [Scytonema sp. UIC 10036]MUH01643.1 RNA-binding protein hfq [Scytonema sp. UIC 10036]
MITEFDTSLPSIRQVQNLIKEGASVQIKLVTGDLVTGKMIWQDVQCLCCVDENKQHITVWKQAIAYIKPMM